MQPKETTRMAQNGQNGRHQGWRVSYGRLRDRDGGYSYVRTAGCKTTPRLCPVLRAPVISRTQPQPPPELLSSPRRFGFSLPPITAKIHQFEHNLHDFTCSYGGPHLLTEGMAYTSKGRCAWSKALYRFQTGARRGCFARLQTLGTHSRPIGGVERLRCAA